MRLKQEDLAGFITETLLNVRAGIQAARDQGIIGELPGEISFSVEIIDTPQSLSSVTTTEGTASKTGSATKPEIVDTSLKTGGGQTTTENSTDNAVRTVNGSKEEDSTQTQNGTTTGTTTGTDAATDSTERTATKQGTETNTQIQTGSQVQNSNQGRGSTVEKSYN